MVTRSITYAEGTWALLGPDWEIISHWIGYIIWRHTETKEIVFTHGEIHDEGNRWRVIDIEPRIRRQILALIAIEKMELI